MYTIPTSYKRELHQYRKLLNKFLCGAGDPLQFKIFRVVRGVYEQRNKGTFMIRIRCAGGTISPNQLYHVSRIAGNYGSEFLHITTRQELQLHNIQLSDTAEILDDLYKIGLSTKGSGGNTVRNITASVESGISSKDVFDVTPYNIALTNFLLDCEKSFDLPRKLKIAFSSSEKDSALAMYNDLGFIAKKRNGEIGFKVFLGGSPSVKPMIGEVLFDFLPADKIFGVTLAVVEMFNKYGNRKKRTQARLRYLFYKMGKEIVFQLFEEFYKQHQEVRYNIVNNSEQPNITPRNSLRDFIPENKIKEWASNFVKPQMQDGICSIEIPVMHGNLTLIQAKSISDFAMNFGIDTIRFSRRQNVQLRNIPETFLGSLYNTLKEARFELERPYLLGSLVSCTGADTCQLGICFSKGGLQAINDRLSHQNWINELNDISINISGCSNACGQHLVADLGFSGRVSRNQRIYPSYNVFAGAVVGEKGASLPVQLGKVAAKDLPEFTDDILATYYKNSCDRPFAQFVKEEQTAIEHIFEKYGDIPSYDEDPNYYMDWGNNDLFTTDTRGKGECSTGLLDMIESEKKVIRKCKNALVRQQGIEEQTILIQELIITASKLLSHTIHEQPNKEKDLFDLIHNQFITNKILSNDFVILFRLIEEEKLVELFLRKELAIKYADTALNYYKNLDDSHQHLFKLKEIAVKELKQLLDNQEELLLIDVRESWEKEIADIGGMLIPLGMLEENLDLIPKKKKTIIYCRTGRRSSEAINLIAKKRDIENIYNLKGGIYAWSEEIDSTIKKY